MDDTICVYDRPLTLPAPAKINLFLDITGRRADGYHTLTGVMQSVSLSDTVTLSLTCAAEDHIYLTCSDPALPTDRGNLAYRAAELFLACVRTVVSIPPLSVSIHIDKRIPYPAGLAGGSTDAAAVLRGLNRLVGSPLTAARLESVGARLGADVPFCVRGGTCITEGVGDELTPCPALPPCDILIVCAGEGVSTPEAYRSLDAAFGNFAPGAYEPHRDLLRAQLAALSSGSLSSIGASSFNLFESVILPRHSSAGALLSRLRDAGALCARMSGSGPSVFGLFPLGMARPLCASLRREHIPAWVCEPVGH